VTVIGGFRSFLSITRETDGNLRVFCINENGGNSNLFCHGTQERKKLQKWNNNLKLGWPVWRPYVKS